MKNLKMLFAAILLCFSFFCVGCVKVEAKDDNTVSKTDEIVMYEGVKDNGGSLSCNKILGDKSDKSSLMSILSTIYKLAGVAAVILVIVLSMLDFTKAMTGDDSDMLNKSFKVFVKRLVFLMAFFLVPTIVQLIFDLVFGPGSTCAI